MFLARALSDRRESNRCVLHVCLSMYFASAILRANTRKCDPHLTSRERIGNAILYVMAAERLRLFIVQWEIVTVFSLWFMTVLFSL